MSLYRMNNIETLFERLESLQIMNKTSSKTNEWIDKEMSMEIAPAMTNNNVQAVMPKSMISDPGWFDRDWTKFEDWWREIQLFLKSNRVLETNDKITVILAHFRRGIVDIYVQKKLDELDEELEIQDWNKFVKKIKTMFSNKTKAENAKWKIEYSRLYDWVQNLNHEGEHR